MREQVQWTSPSPLWNVAARVEEPTLRRTTLQRPALLRFASDDFMDDFTEMLASDPARLKDLVARPETWRGIVAEKPVLPATALPTLAKKFERMRLTAQREKTPVTTSASNKLARLSSDVALDQDARSRLKFYQPAHQRYYLVTAHLVCGRAGLPDRSINAARN